MRPALLASLFAALAASSPTARAAPPPDLPAAIYTDPAPDAAHPARMEVLHIPSHGLEIVGVAYLASGAGPHPTLVLLHGLPGNEKNLDLAQAVRRAGWNVVTFNYRGSWGSPGAYAFGQNLEDADSVLAFVRAPDHAKALGIDASRLAIAGHSMGGWVAVNTAAHDHGLIGVISISAGDMARIAGAPQPVREALMAENMEALAGVTAKSLAEEVTVSAPSHPMSKAAGGLVSMPYLALTSDDGLAADTDGLVAAIRAQGGTQVTTVHAATDHSWSDHRIALESAVIHWLQGLK